MKKNMICGSVQKKIAAGETLSPEEKIHADRCPDCGNFLAFCGKIGGLSFREEREIPKEVENVIRSEAFRNLIRRKRRSLFCRIGIPAAAAVFVCAFLLCSGTGRPVPAGREEPSLQSMETVWSADYDEKLLSMACEMDSVMDEMDESIRTVSI